MGFLTMSARPVVARAAVARVLTWVLACALGLAVPSRAQPVAGDGAAKARFATTMLRFVNWPAASNTGDVHLCLVHQSPAVAAAFSAYNGSTVLGRRLDVVLNPTSRAAACDLVFVDGSAPRASPVWPRGDGGTPTLTIGAIDGFLSHGGMIELVNVNDKLRFDVNLAALRVADLSLSSQALKLARQVRD